MANIIEFKVVKNNAEKIRSTPCDSPIAVLRVDSDLLAISFRLDCFDVSIVENSLKRVLHAQNQWKLYKAGRTNPSYRRMYVTYLIQVNGNLTLSELDEVFTQIVSLVTKEVYAEEISVQGSRVEVAELATPYAVGPFAGITVSHKTVSVLQNAGMNSAYDVAVNTRESLCRIPGMTTQRVCKIEKSLATRGLYLNTAEVPKWKD